MQRQSLGSPGSKHAGTAINREKSAAVVDEESKRASLRSQSSLLFNNGVDTDDEEEKIKLLKPHHHRSSPAALKRKQPEKMIHAIPVLNFVFFLILYLASSDPSQIGLDDFAGLKRLEMLKEKDVARASRLFDMKNKSGSVGDVVEIRRLRNVREIQKLKPRFHRKFGDF